MHMRKHTMPAVDLSRLPPHALFAAAGRDDPAAILDELGGEIKRIAGQMQSYASDANKTLAASARKQQELDGRVREVEQTLVRRPGPGAPNARNEFMAALTPELCRDMAEGVQRHGRVRLAINAAILSGPPAGPGIAPPADRREGIVAPAQRGARVRDLMAVIPTSSASIEYVRETGFTNAAAMVSQGATKPESTLTFELKTANARVIAHWTQASRQILDDVPRLQNFLDGRLRYGVQLKEDQQILLGDGTGQNLHGLVPQATAFNAPLGMPLTTMADKIGAAIAQLRAIEFEADGIVMHPTDWQRLLQAKGSDGHYLIPGGPFSTTPPALFGKPVALTTGMTQDDFLVGQFQVGVEAFEREETQVEISTEDRDNFIKNMVTILAEERLMLAVYRPEAFVFGDFGNLTG